MSVAGMVPRGVPAGVWALSAVSAVVSTGFGMAVPLIPVLGEKLGASALEIGLLMAGFYAGRLLAEIPAGVASDRVGRTSMVLVALAGYAVACAGYAALPAVAPLIAFRALQGLSAGFFGVAARSLVSDLCPTSVRGSGQGVFSASFNLGFVVGPALGTLLASRFGFSTPFWWAAAACAFAFLGLFAAARLRRLLPFDHARARGPRASAAKLLDSRVALLALANLSFWAGMSVVMTLFPIAGKAEERLGIGFVGVALAAAGLGGLLFGPAAGRLSDRLGRAPVIAAGAVLSAFEGAALLARLDAAWVVIAFAIGGLGAAAFSNGLFAALGDLTVWRGRGTSTGLVGTAGVLGGILGALLAPVFWRAFDLESTFGLQPLFAAAALVFALGFWQTGRRIPRARPSLPPTEPVLPG